MGWKKDLRSPPLEEKGVEETDDELTDDCNCDELIATSICHPPVPRG